MRSPTLVAGLVASLALASVAGPSGAQPYYDYYGSNGYYYSPPPSNYYYSRPVGYAYPYHHYYHRHHYYYHHRYYRYGYGYHRYAYCGYRQHRAGAIGAVAGGIGGGIIGAAITHGNPAYAMVGAGLGALTGHAIGRSSHPYPC
jgi:hypothetical protein